MASFAPKKGQTVQQAQNDANNSPVYRQSMGFATGQAQSQQSPYSGSTPYQKNPAGDFAAYSPSSNTTLTQTYRQGSSPFGQAPQMPSGQQDGNWANYDGAPSPYSQFTASYGSPMGGSASQPNFPQRDAFIQNINNQMTPYMTGQASGAPQFNFNQAWSQAGDMVNNGWQNPFTAVSQQSFPSQYQPAPTQPLASPPASPSQTAGTWGVRLTPELEAELQGRRASPPAPNMVERRQAMINRGQPPAAPQQSGGIVNNMGLRGREPSDEQKAAQYWASQGIVPGMQRRASNPVDQRVADARASGVNAQTNSYGDVVGSHADRARFRPARGMGTGRPKVWT